MFSQIIQQVVVVLSQMSQIKVKSCPVPSAKPIASMYGIFTYIYHILSLDIGLPEECSHRTDLLEFSCEANYESYSEQDMISRYTTCSFVTDLPETDMSFYASVTAVCVQAPIVTSIQSWESKVPPPMPPPQ